MTTPQRAQPAPGRKSVAAALAEAYRRAPIPYAVRRQVSPTAAAIVSNLRRAKWRLTPKIEPTPGPLIVSGLFETANGIGRAGRLTLEAFKAYEPRALPIEPHLRALPLSLTPFPVEEPGGVWILHCNPPEMLAFFEAFAHRAWAGRWRIGYWAWELARMPRAWRRAADFVDEVWAPTAFVAEAARAAGIAKPIRVAPHPPPNVAGIAADRAAFGFEPGEILILAMFDGRSSFARKNPMGAVQAYLRAFPRPEPGVRLVVKALAGDAETQSYAALQAALANRPDVALLSRRLSDQEALTLLASIDVLLSLHRSEGFGLTLLEALALGRTIISTTWSGPADFLSPDCLMPVGYRLVPVADPGGRYVAPDLSWAEPDLDHAAALLREAASDAALRARLAVAGPAQVARLPAGPTLSPQAAALIAN